MFGYIIKGFPTSECHFEAFMAKRVTKFMKKLNGFGFWRWFWKTTRLKTSKNEVIFTWTYFYSSLLVSIYIFSTVFLEFSYDHFQLTYIKYKIEEILKKRSQKWPFFKTIQHFSRLWHFCWKIWFHAQLHIIVKPSIFDKKYWFFFQWKLQFCTLHPCKSRVNYLQSYKRMQL